MSRNEIRLRRHRMTASGADRFRNYSDVLSRHERDMKVRKIIRVFLMFMLILALIGMIFFLSQIEEKEPLSDPTHSATYEPGLSTTP